MRSLIIALVMLLGASSLSVAQDYERTGPFLSLEGYEDVLFLAGDITPQTPLDFRLVLTRHPEVKSLVLVSNGGSVTGGLLLADDVYLREINTFVPRDGGCYSACAFVFFAGKARQASGELGVHQFYGGEDTAEQAQFVVSDIIDMLTKFDTPQPVVSRMLRTTADDMYVFSPDEVVELAINRETISLRTLSKRMSALPSDFQVAMLRSLETVDDTGDVATTSTETAPQSLPRFAIYSGVDFYGADVGKIRVNDVGQCLDACFENRQCRAITLNTNPAFRTGPNCFLKNGMGRAEFYEQAVSGVFLLQSESETLTVDGQPVRPDEVFAPD